MKQTELGTTGIRLSALGYGAMPLALDSRPSKEDAIRVLHGIFDLGITFIDTADSYCIDEEDKHYNERIICEALNTYDGDTNTIKVATKGGIIRPNGRWDPNGDPEYLYRTIQESHQALGGQKPLFLWQHHAPDPRFSISESLSAAKKAQEEGLIQHIGVSNYSCEQLEEAKTVLEVVSVQNQFNPWYRNTEHNGVLEYCKEFGLTFIPWSPFGGMGRAKRLGDIGIIQDAAEAEKRSPQQIVLCWLFSKYDKILPIPGASRLESIQDCTEALNLNLSDQWLEKINSGL